MKSSLREARDVGKFWVSVGEQGDSLHMERRASSSSPWGQVTVDFGPFLPRVCPRSNEGPPLHTASFNWVLWWKEGVLYHRRRSDA